LRDATSAVIAAIDTIAARPTRIRVRVSMRCRETVSGGAARAP
jgi:hypothetical protein